MQASISGTYSTLQSFTQGAVVSQTQLPGKVNGKASFSTLPRSSFFSTQKSFLWGSRHLRSQFSFDKRLQSDRKLKLKLEAVAGGNGSPASSNTGAEFASLTASTQSAPSSPPSSSSDSYPGSPLLWVGVGVALCVFVTKAVEWLKKRLMKLAMEQMMNQMGGKGGSTSPFGQSSPFPGFPPSSGFPPSPGAFTPPGPFSSPPPFASSPPSPPFASTPLSPPPPSTTARKEGQVSSSNTSQSTPLSSDKGSSSPREAAVFVDVDPKPSSSPSSPSSPTSSSPSSPTSSSPSEASNSSSSKQTDQEPKKRFFQDAEVVDDSSNTWSGWSGYTSTNTNGNGGAGKSTETGRVTIEQLEQMLETPAIQNLVLQYVPEYMRNPDTIKWLLKNPEIRQKIEEQLGQLSEGEYGNQMADMLKQFDLTNPELTKQFETMGVTPEQAVQTIMSDPEVASAFQNPKIQMAILECAQNPANQLKYINDKEVMDVFEKISRLFPQTM